MSNKVKKPESALDILADHFSNFSKFEADITGLPFKLYVEPLNFEQTLALVAASKNEDYNEQAREYARLIQEVFRTKAGAYAFTCGVTALLEKLPATSLTELVTAMFEQVGANAEELEDFCNKKK